MEWKGSLELMEFWGYLQHESPRGTAVVAAAFFAERLGKILVATESRSFSDKIDDAASVNLITSNEREDLHVIRKLRNAFAHDLRQTDFDGPKAAQVESLRTWQIISSALPQYRTLFPTARDRVLYVSASLAIRLTKRTLPRVQTRPEPDVCDFDAFPRVTDR